MSKLNLILISCCVTTAAFSQTFNFKPATTAPADVPTPLYSEAPLPVKSPSDFKAGVKSLAKENQDSLDQELKQTLKPMPVKPPEQPPPPPPDANQAAGKPPETKSPGEVPPPPPQQPTETPQTTPMTTAAPPQQRQPTVTPPTAPPPPSLPTQTYTGFGAGGNQGQSNQSGSQPAGGGWNIKY